MVTDIIAIAG